MITLRDVRLRRGPEILINSASLSIFRGEKIGVVGRNGSGKSSLLAMLRGEFQPDQGSIERPPQLALACVAQELPDSERALVEFVIDGDSELRATEALIEQARAKRDGLREAALLADFEHAGGYTARSRAAALLDGLGFPPDSLDRALNEFSGGLKMRAALARTLMRRSELLMLDEPTNHLDLDAVLWLQQWLNAYAGTILLVSHDREFLDAVVNRVLHIGAQQITPYSGNYSSFEAQHAASRQRTAALADSQQRERAHIESFIARFKASASKARQAQSRMKWLERLPAIATLQEEHEFHWNFLAPNKLANPLLAVSELQAGYYDASGIARPILRGVRLDISANERLGILGRNGAGKSTLMRTIAGELPKLAGTRTPAADFAPGFFAQSELERLDSSSTALLELSRRGGEYAARWSMQDKRNHLGRFGFRGERVFEPITHFSGGERARLALSILVAQRPNLLLLDEPTNHLDFEMRHSLLLALQEFEGAVVIVSHDRALLRGICDRFILVGNGHVQDFDGDLEDYASWLARQGAARDSAAPEAAAATPGKVLPAAERRETRKREAEARNRLSPLRKELQDLELKLTEWTAERGAIEAQLASETFHKQPQATVTAALADLGRLRRAIESAETRWFEVSEQLEKLTLQAG